MLLKHKDNTDVAIEVLKKYYIEEKESYKLKVRWWNTGRTVKPWCMWIDQYIMIKKSDMHKWEPFDN